MRNALWFYLAIFVLSAVVGFGLWQRKRHEQAPVLRFGVLAIQDTLGTEYELIYSIPGKEKWRSKNGRIEVTFCVQAAGDHECVTDQVPKGDAATTGDHSPAVTGNGNTITTK